MPRLDFKLRTDDGTKQEELSHEIPSDEWERLLVFHREAERLRSTSFVQNSRGGQINFNWKVGEPLQSKSAPIDFDEVAGMLLRLRPFVLQKEECYFHKIKNVLSRWFDHPAFRAHIAIADRVFSLKSTQQSIRIELGGRPPLSVEVVMDWLNAHEYHRDSDKLKQVQEDLGVLGQDQNGLPVVLFALTDMVQAVLVLDDLIATVMEVSSGERSDIICPPEFLSRGESDGRENG